MSGIFRFGWAVSLAGCRRTERTSEDRKAQQTAKDGHTRTYHRPTKGTETDCSRIGARGKKLLTIPFLKKEEINDRQAL